MMIERKNENRLDAKNNGSNSLRLLPLLFMVIQGILLADISYKLNDVP